MGTDINYRFQKINDADKWETIKVDQDLHHDGKYQNWREGEYYIGRHYILFAVLAGVRNGYGFAGVETHEPLIPIAKGRGLPHLIESDWFEESSNNAYGIEINEPKVERLELGDHSFTWVLSSEIFNWFSEDHIIHQYGVVSVEDYLKMERFTEPASYSGGICGNGIVVYDEVESENKLPFSMVRGFKSYADVTHVRIKWKLNVNDRIQYFHDMIKKLHDQYGEIRMIMGFDS